MLLTFIISIQFKQQQKCNIFLGCSILVQLFTLCFNTSKVGALELVVARN